ncbi:HAMP domain-containing protein [Alkalihalobacillus deserti]|uniref:HAMP domain-containing protein n=1 Tax=Alkalihalobacillus deserti TaxID=2879466 RepID=UPI001D138171|nr:HAMP domain-containing protein [Alkalihalobacillus deserti]
MKRNTIMMQLLVKIGFFLGLLAIIILVTGYYLINLKMESYQEEQINNATGVVVHAMDSTQQSAETIEHMIENLLYASSKGIMSELRGKEIEDINMEELRVLADNWDVEEISLWQRIGDDIVTVQSSDETQLEMGSKDWGYWFTAFDQLMSGQAVTVEQGTALDNYWVGPISRAERFEHIYYKFAYYYDGTTDFMINPFISDEEIYNLTFQAGPTQMIEKIIAENMDIEEIAVINVPAWLRGEDNDVVEPAIDLPVLYGSHQFELEQDEEILLKVQRENKNYSELFEKDGVSYKKLFKPLAHDRVMAITLDLSRQKQMGNQFLFLFLGGFLLASVLLFIIIRFIVRRQLKPLQNIVEHIQGVAEGDLTKRLTIKEKNELDWLAENINDMTQRFHQLIMGVKEESHSLVIVSSLLSRQVYTSVKTMGETSTTMTSESKTILLEISITLEKLQRLSMSIHDNELNTLGSGQLEGKKSPLIKKSLNEVLEKLTELEGMVKEHSTHVTDITLMFYDTLKELNEALQKMDQLSTELNEKIKFFQVKDDR